MESPAVGYKCVGRLVSISYRVKMGVYKTFLTLCFQNQEEACLKTRCSAFSTFTSWVRVSCNMRVLLINKIWKKKGRHLFNDVKSRDTMV
ncbi:hypothetical protein WN944_006708 [Citrus x changshan-huyou]|uniref:Uncharacterized protein n=1 Tax=Citrus x changshan-huyou TaxID=2935761 RepID=A0AAP0QU33_9ROSI